MENYSLSDLAAVTNDGFGGGGSAWWIIILFLFAFMNGGIGNNKGFSDYATAASQNEILSGQKFDALGAKVNSIADGISSLGYSQLQTMNSINTNLGNAITTEGRALQTQLAECCCSTKEAIHAEGEATRSMIQQNKIETLQNQVNALQTQQAIQNAMCGVPKINPYMYGIVPTYNNCNCI